MKKIYTVGLILSLALLVLVLSATHAKAEDLSLSQFEVPVSCLWKKSEGRCVIQNRTNAAIICAVTVSAKTESGLKVGNTRTIVVQPRMYNDAPRVFVTEKDTLTSVTGFADCRV